jgi:UDP-N-acetylglucosamine 2-epimerase (non-hydrolysing)
MKIAPIIDAIERSKSNGSALKYRLVHTGQHYDKNMSDQFFEQLDIPAPHVNLECGGGSQAEQAANIMIQFERELLAHPADVVLVVGDVTSTLACSIVAKKLLAKVAHVEAGIRSFDLAMPEEINRMVTDSITDYFFTTSQTANINLRKAGIEESKIFYVGNTMIDTLLRNRKRFAKPCIWHEHELESNNYFVVTLHRPANVDQEENLKQLIEQIVVSAKGLPIIFPVHPRTARKLEITGVKAVNLHMVQPLGYLEFNYLVQHSKAVVTDSGGITEETTVMGVPCMTLRDNTERPETITEGTNELIGTDPKNISPAFEKLFAGRWKKGGIPELWDGQTSERIVAVLNNLCVAND